jgi:hypothetical protein
MQLKRNSRKTEFPGTWVFFSGENCNLSLRYENVWNLLRITNLLSDMTHFEKEKKYTCLLKPWSTDRTDLDALQLAEKHFKTIVFLNTTY